MTTPDEVRSMDVVTDVTTGPAGPATGSTGMAPDLDAAVQASDAAAQAAGVSVRPLESLEELDQVVALYSTIWGRAANPPMTVELLRAFTKAGNYVAGAHDGERLVGACVGFFHAPAEDALHSHIAGVSGSVAGRHVGFALKLHQRAWAMLRGVSVVAWTFDPLVCRNAHFNLAKLGGRADEYLPNFYGPMLDSINGDDDTDRLLVRWRLRDPAVVLAGAGGGVGLQAAEELAAGASLLLAVGPDGGPETRRASGRGGTALVAVHRDIEALRVSDPALAKDWRRAVREVLGGLMADGGRIAGFDRAGFYVVRSAR